MANRGLVRWVRVLVLFVAVFGAAFDVAHGADLRAPFDFESAAVLPKGVRSPRFRMLYMFMDERWGGSGDTEALGYRLNKTVSWRDVIDGQSDAQLKAIAQGKVMSLGYDLDGSAGSTSGVVNTYVNVKVPVLSMGVTDKLTLAVAVPIVSIQVNADTGLIASDQGRQFTQSFVESDPDKAQEVQYKLNDAVNTKLKRLGYEPIRSFTSTNVGDVRVVSKYQIARESAYGVAVKGEATVPSGVAPNVDKALDTPTGDGQWDVGATLIYEQYLNASNSLRATVFGGYTAQLPDHLDRRLPVSDRDSLSSDKDYVARDLGDVVSTGLSMAYELPFGVNFGAGYSFQRQNKASIEGTRYEQFRYRLLEANTMQILHAATLGGGFSSVQMYREKRFKIPFQANVAYSLPLAGVNTVKNGFWSFEFVMFF